MTDSEYQLTLVDRVAVIKVAYEKFNLEKNGYISFSGGKDSTVLSYLFDIAVPGNKIPRIFINTGIEFNDIVSFVRKMISKDSRFMEVSPSSPIVNVLKKYGYPFKSKEHSRKVYLYQMGSKCKTVAEYSIGDSKFSCPKILRYQFNPGFKIPVSDQCCIRLKKRPAHEYEKASGRKVAILGLRLGEGGQRRNHPGCKVLDEDGKLIKFKPLNPVSEEWEEEFIKRNQIQLCQLYYPPFNFKRTGCKGCPFALELQDELDVMGNFLGSERKQCEAIWKPIYDEYRRLGYRLRKDDKGKN